VDGSNSIALAIVGLGYWGPNLLRNAWDVEGVRVAAVCDRDQRRLEPVARRYPTVRATQRYEEILGAEDVDAVVLATPVRTHHALAREALMAGKHVFVEKPLAQTSAECRELIELADQRSLVLMPGHTFLYSPPVAKIKELLKCGELGEIFFVTSSRVNLGIHQSDASVVRDLGPHDFSMLLHWLGQPTFVRAIGRDSIGSGQLDVAFIDMGLSNGALVHLELSWLAPTKLRRTVLVGSGKMVVYEDTSAEQVRVFDRGVESLEPQSFGEYQLSYRSGDVLTPRLEPDEPLRLEMEDFVASIRERREPLSNKRLGLDVVRIVEAAEVSLTLNGSPTALDTPPGDRRRTGDRRRSQGGMPFLARTGVHEA
jgi:predicted dehydrogenase